MASALSNPSITFPLRLRQGLLQKADEQEAYLMLLEIMARTPRGSWAGHALFGFQEFFPEVTKEGLAPEARSRITDRAVQEINIVLADLGLTRYRVDSLTLDSTQQHMPWKAGAAAERQGVTLMLRESSGKRASGYIL